jgi:transcriptional regulator with XRE-family HTH domain
VSLKRECEAFAENFRRLLPGTGLNSSAVARQLGVSRAAMHKWASGQQMPPEARIQQIAECLNVRPKHLTAPLPDVVALPELSTGVDDWSMWSDADGTPREGLNPRLGRGGRWVLPADAVLPFASSSPDLVVVKILGNDMSPKLTQGDYTIVDLNWRDCGTPGFYLVNNPLRIEVWHLQPLSGETVRLEQLATKFTQELNEKEIQIVGRIVLKLSERL